MTPSQAPLLPATLAPVSLPAVPAVQSMPVAVAGVLFGDGLAPKLIQQLEFVEMADLLPEAWLVEESTMEAAGASHGHTSLGTVFRHVCKHTSNGIPRQDCRADGISVTGYFCSLPP